MASPLTPTIRKSFYQRSIKKINSYCEVAAPFRYEGTRMHCMRHVHSFCIVNAGLSNSSIHSFFLFAFRFLCQENIQHPTACNWSNVLALTSYTSEVVFKIKLFYFWDPLIVSKCFLIIKINYFRGDPSDISPKTATLSYTL